MMDINTAFEHLISSEAFRSAAKGTDKTGGHYRVLKTRYVRGSLKTGAMVDLLITFSYRIEIKKPL